MNNLQSMDADGTLRFGAYVFHRQQRLVSKAGWPVPLGGRALDILAVLLEAPGQFVDKATLIERVWPCSVVEENNLRVHIAALRRAFDGQRYILNDPQRGYCFAAVVQGAPLLAAAPRHNLGARLSPVIGRDELLGMLARRLSGQRLITLSGYAGVGKSTLALALAERVLPRYRDGVWWVDLATVKAPRAMFEQVAAVLQLQPPGTPDELARQLASRQLLLVLDGADLLLSACRQWLRAIRAYAPRVSVLISSREPLHLPGEWVQQVPRLAVPAPAALGSVEQALVCPAVQLFVARARAGQQGFVLRPQDLAPLRDIVWRLDGLPLALELAAAQVDALGMRGVQAQLRKGLQVLTRGRRTAVERHRSLMAALDWTYERLSLPERWLFLQLGLFKQAVDLPTLSALVTGTELEHADLSYVLARLVNVSLLSVQPGPGARRYRLLNCLRSYALAQLRDPRQVERLQHGYTHYLGTFSGRPFVLQLVEQAASVD
ncbi:winged helix-turn-helix domain-containing protein [Pseudomonas sp. S1Bt30]|uniref:Winged helix-turn-helix domain-containing protein n=2 Tax=Pseudomonas TaxID=286 RepID=A0ABY6QPJ2_9PSED|nr:MULTISPECIES: winged helix-turn-helix domain-containing protein [Pseudomonas]MCX4065770.1 winged helix-turn-helix domain-containing protein [Pseudomonas quebecensis]UZW20668.1 winged helix-turn-helix domain-containing protein [Pseudomonas quebecensis]UZW21914.1 winged helix-turn-helix domain-containing protein [Pseudomonas quebecensis]UZW26974.1 winged helix-turn-helix domain-containing protein [Pseudomonas quebecensis]